MSPQEPGRRWIPQTPDQQLLADALTHLGGAQKLAERLGVKEQTVRSWQWQKGEFGVHKRRRLQDAVAAATSPGAESRDALGRAETLLAQRLRSLEQQLPADGGASPLWDEYQRTARTLMDVRAQVARDREATRGTAPPSKPDGGPSSRRKRGREKR